MITLWVYVRLGQSVQMPPGEWQAVRRTIHRSGAIVEFRGSPL